MATLPARIVLLRKKGGWPKVWRHPTTFSVIPTGLMGVGKAAGPRLLMAVALRTDPTDARLAARRLVGRGPQAPTDVLHRRPGELTAAHLEAGSGRWAGPFYSTIEITKDQAQYALVARNISRRLSDGSWQPTDLREVYPLTEDGTTFKFFDRQDATPSDPRCAGQVQWNMTIVVEKPELTWYFQKQASVVCSGRAAVPCDCDMEWRGVAK